MFLFLNQVDQLAIVGRKMIDVEEIEFKTWSWRRPRSYGGFYPRGDFDYEGPSNFTLD
jgi:hypothetical protein